MLDFAPELNTKIQDTISPVLRFLYKDLRLTPNKLSVIGFSIGAAGVIPILMHQPIYALPFIALGLLFDGFDGAVARQYRLTSAFGRTLDTTLDRIQESMLIAAFVLAGYIEFKLALFALISVLLMTSVKDRSGIDPGFKRFALLLGFFITFNEAIKIVFLVNLLGYIVSLIVIDYRDQVATDAKSHAN